MIRTTLTAAAAVLTLAAAPAIAGGADQLARTLGVAPGAYSLAQLTELKELRSAPVSGAEQRIAQILDNPAAEAISSRSALSTPSAGQFAARLGVAPGTLSTAELARLDIALIENDFQEADFILSGAGDAAVTGTDAAKAQLASRLGVNPADYTAAELFALVVELEDDEH